MIPDFFVHLCLSASCLIRASCLNLYNNFRLIFKGLKDNALKISHFQVSTTLLQLDLDLKGFVPYVDLPLKVFATLSFPAASFIWSQSRQGRKFQFFGKNCKFPVEF